MQENITKFYQFLANHHLMVISTCSKDCLPHSSVVGYYTNPDLTTYFATSKNSVKYQHLQTNPKVSLTIGFEKGKTMQIDGTCKELMDKEGMKLLIDRFNNIPTMGKYLPDSERVFYQVTPSMLKLTDIHLDPWQVDYLEL